MRNAASCAPTRQKRVAVLAILHAVFDERDPALVRELYHLACEEMADICPRAAGLLEDAEADALAEKVMRLKTAEEVKDALAEAAK